VEDTKIRVIIAGSRTLSNILDIRWAIANSGFPVEEIVSGHARGVDQTAEQFAIDEGIDMTVFHANWSKGRVAGFLRNKKMADYADALIAVWDGVSPGTANMIKTMEALGKPVYVYKTTI
jgi:hypothetical protein